MVRLGDTHEEILVADIKSAVVTSLNFLSFRGDPKKGLRRETGLYSEGRATIEELAADFMRRVESVEAATPAQRARALGSR